MVINYSDHKNMTFYLVICILTLIDITLDFRAGVGIRQLLIELIILFISLVGLNYYFDRIQNIAKKNHEEALKLKEEKQRSQFEIEMLKKEVGTFKNQFKYELDQQFKTWSLTPAESEVAVFLLKGFSLKEIAESRKSNEKTIRAQCSSIYKKSNLKGRSQLSSYFLDFIV